MSQVQYAPLTANNETVENKLIILSAPSGSGKTTVAKHLLGSSDNFAFSISATTRNKRPNEVDGTDYYFYSQEQFKEAIAQDAFLEHEEVYEGLFYGTLKSEVERLWSEGKTVIFDVDVQGGLNIKNYYGDQALAVFVRPPSVETLVERLRARKTEDEAQLKERIDKAQSELKFEHKFDEVIVNDVLKDTFVIAENVVARFLKSED